MHNDDELYERFLKGETEAFDLLIVRYSDSLMAYLYGCLHDWQDAEDLMMEAFSRIMFKKPRIRGTAFKAYLFKTGRNLAYRLSSRRVRMTPFAPDEMPSVPADDSVEDQVAEKNRNHVLYKCMEHIGDEFREALWLVYFEGLSHPEVAAVMGINLKKADNLVARGRQALRKELEKEGISCAYE